MPNQIMDLDSTSEEDLRELQALLQLIVRKLTRQIFTTPRLTQLDVGNAIVLVQRLDEYPRRFIVRKARAELLRELGKKRPDLHRYVVTLEDAVNDLDQYIGTA